MESNSVCNYEWLTTAWRESDLFNDEYDHRPNWTTQSCYQLIITLTKFVMYKIRLFFKSKHKKFQDVSASCKKSHLSARVMARSVLLNCPIKADIRQMIANQIWEFCYNYDYKHNCPSLWPIYFLQVKQADRYITVRLQKTVNTWF